MSDRRVELEQHAKILLHVAAQAAKTGDTSAVASALRERRITLGELAELDEGADVHGEVATVDDIATRRAARLADANDSASASRRSQPRRRG